MKKHTTLKKIAAVSLIFMLTVATMPVQETKAAALTGMKDTLSRAKISVAGNHIIQFVTPTGIVSTNTVTLTFQNGFNIASVVTADVTLEGNAVTSATLAGQVLTITAGAANVVAAADTADIVISNSHITTPTTAGSYTIVFGGTFGDTGTIAVAIASEDQVSITATVNPYLAFNVTDATIALGTLNVSTVSFDTAAMTAATNSTSGYAITISGATLTSGGNTINAMAGAASVVGTEQFGLNLKDNTAPDVGTEASGGSGAAAAGYSTIDNFKFVTGETVASSAGTSATTTFTMSYIANIANSTEAGSYTATHTYICTGTF